MGDARHSWERGNSLVLVNVRYLFSCWSPSTCLSIICIHFAVNYLFMFLPIFRGATCILKILFFVFDMKCNMFPAYCLLIFLYADFKYFHVITFVDILKFWFICEKAIMEFQRVICAKAGSEEPQSFLVVF